MGVVNIFDMGGWGLSGEWERLKVGGSNVGNGDRVRGGDGEGYGGKEVVLEVKGGGGGGRGGVKVGDVIESEGGEKVVYEGGNGVGDGKG